MAWASILKTVACLMCGGGLIGVLRGSAATGVLAGLILFGLLLAVALPILAAEHLGRKRPRPAGTALENREREAA